MACYKIVVAYDGTNYHGWQLQPNVVTIMQILRSRFEFVFRSSLFIHGASRTDAGVHALGQVATIVCKPDIPVHKLKHAWNNALPPDIVIQDIVQLEDYIHPHVGVVQKTYFYHFFTNRPLPFAYRYGWYIKRPVDIDLLNQALQVFAGTHDFRSFCTGDDLQDTVRTIDTIDIEFSNQFNAYRISVKGKSFLRYMVRRIVGASLEVASRDALSLNNLQTVLLRKDPCHILPNAPAKGLLLYQILYER